MNFPGSKGGAGVAQKIISQMPPHETFIEAFLGTGVITRTKLPSAGSMGIDAHARCPGFELCRSVPAFTGICAHGPRWLAEYPWTGRELVYCDPPYLFSVRRSTERLYRHEFGEDYEHQELLIVLKAIPVPVMLSGYHSALYAQMLPDWRTIEIPTVDRGGNRRIEVVWMNFPEPFELHDYRFIGANFSQRRDIKRKKERWKRKLQKMPALHRAAILQAVAECRTPQKTQCTIFT